MLLDKTRKSLVAGLIVLLLFVSGFGIYLGRFLRWNSWDIIQAPFGLLFDVGDRIVNPLAHSRTWGVTISMGILLNMMYWTIKLIKRAYAPKRDTGTRHSNPFEGAP
jgi:uncharacterized membrane protein